MILTLAIRNLFHDRIRLAVTLVGILFAIVLVAVQLGLYVGASRMIVSMIEKANGELWITSYAAKSFEDSGFLEGHERYAALSTPGVAKVVPLIASFSKWNKPQGGSQLSVIVGTDVEDGGLAPWNIVAGDVEALKLPNAVALDQTYLDFYGIKGLGEIGEVENQRVRVTAMTHGIRSFTTIPYIFTTLNRARRLFGLSSEAATFFLVQLEKSPH